LPAKKKTRNAKPKCGTDQLVKVHSTGQRFVDIHINAFKKCEGDPCIRGKHAELQLISRFARTTQALEKETVDLKRLPCLRCAQLLYDTKMYQLNIEEDPKSEEDGAVLELLATRIRLNFLKDKKSKKKEKILKAPKLVKCDNRRSHEPHENCMGKI